MNGERLVEIMGGILFCCAATILLNFSNELSTLSEIVYASDQVDSYVISEKKENDTQVLTVRYEQILSELMNTSLSYDLLINGVAIQSSDYNMSFLTKFLPPKNIPYKKIVVHDEYGNVRSVNYEMDR